jgi:hypothetical protein
LAVSGSTLCVGTPTGLSTYNIGQIVSVPVTISVTVPANSANETLVANSFNIPPTPIINGTSSNTYVWDEALASGNTNLSFSWQTELSNLNPGDNPA